MRICIPTEDDRGLDAALSGHYGRAPYFTLIDTETEDVKSVPNPGCHERHHHDRDCHHIDILRAHGVEAVIGDHVGHRAAEGLRAAGIEVWCSPSTVARDALHAFRQGALAPLPVGAGCEGRHGHPHGAPREPAAVRGTGWRGPGFGRGSGRGRGLGFGPRRGRP